MNALERAAYTIISFLSQRDVPALTRQYVENYFGGKIADAVIVFGNDLPQVAEAGCMAWKKGVGRRLIFCGGIGHSTEFLKYRFGKDIRYRECNICDSEAEMFAEIAVRLYGISRDCILLDTTSGNCGENAENAGKLLRKNDISNNRLILLQDPLLQRRSVMSLKRFMPETSSVLSYAPFLPKLDTSLTPVFEQKALWTRERFLELLLGEIRRLRDDEDGYGPNGARYIGHVDIPEKVQKAWQLLYDSEQNCRKRC